MPAFAVDSNCMIAAVCSWHEHHAQAVKAIERRLDRGDRMVVAAHALVEAYAVLTRLPSPHRLAASDAWTLIDHNFATPAAVVALTGAAHAALLGRLARAGIGGGRTYDALIAAAAAKGRAGELLTFNAGDFDPAITPIATVAPD